MKREALRFVLPTGHQFEFYHDIDYVGVADWNVKSASMARRFKRDSSTSP